jgi:integrase
VTGLSILLDAHGHPWKPTLLSQYLTAALVRLGLSNDLGGHGLRKLAAARLADAGCSTPEIAAITGHRTLSMVQLYTRSADQARLVAVAIDRFTGSGANNGQREKCPRKIP